MPCVKRKEANVVSGKLMDKPNAATHKSQARNDPYIISCRKLNELLEKESNDLLLSLLCPKLGFLKLLSSSSTHHNNLSLVMAVIANACVSEHAQSALLEFLRQVNESCLLKQVFPQYLCNIIANGNQQNLNEELMMNALFVFENLLKRLPSKSMPTVTLLVTQIKIATMLAFPSQVVQNATRKVEDLMARNQKQIQMGCIMKDQEEPQSMSWDPGEMFRRLSVVPTSQDLHGQRDPYLSKNLIFGQYTNVNDYLDVQFRLLREDLIRPLREGLAKLLEWKKYGSNNRLKTDLKLYNKVHIVSPNFGTQGLIYKINFDVKHFRHVVWERSKRLNFGSLVCLSSDQFKTILVATVAEREVASIRQGEIHLLFQNEDSMQQVDLRAETSYEMIESPAYFEAYKPVLEGLQFMDENSLPFAKYLLNHRGKNEFVAPPAYLLTKVTEYNFAPIIPSLSRSETSTGDLESEVVSDHLLMHGPHHRLMSKTKQKYMSDPLNFETWPSAEQLKLDLSQYNALKAALTTEFVVIQGPPGTGKTYIGLKIVQVLLANEQAWNSFDESCPIIIVCFTNHALDQFLELIIDCKLISNNNDLVRIGSQSKSAKLKFHLIKEIRREGGFRYGGNRHEALENMQTLQNEIIPLAAYMELSKEQIFGESKLQRYMTQSQVKTLYSRKTSNDSIFLLWLMDNSAQPDEIKKLLVNKEIIEENEIDPEMDYANNEDEGKEYDKDDINVKKKENFREAKNKRLLGGDFLVDVGEQEESKRKQLRLVCQAFQTVMSESEAKSCVNVWTLTPADRWRLYNYWVSQHVEPELQRLTDLLVEHGIQKNIVNEISKEEDYQVMRSAKIIGMTTTGSARYRDVLQRVQPRIVIVEEAAEVLEAHIVTSLSKGCEHLILIGDHQQLRPNPTVYQLAKDYNLNISLFERMVLNELPYERLTIQHRMRPEIVELIVPHIYESLVNAESVLQYDNVWGILGNIFFLNHSFEEECADDGQSHSNVHEARFISALCKYFIGVGYKPSQITILTTYTGQMFLFRKYIPKSSFEGLRITPVDNYQGEENDIILLSLVRSNKDGNIGFLNIPNRVCVALSRAKIGCFIIGNGDQLADGSRLWYNILASLKKHSRVVDSLPLACHKHPENVINVSSENDFQLVPDGGCSIPCDYRLDCGHVCEFNCHHFDAKHTQYFCLKNCTRSCPVDHPCNKLCYVPCGGCQVLVQKTLSRCQHTHLLRCYIDEKHFKCEESCRKSCEALSHPCQKSCFKECGNCMVPVEKLLNRCGHREMVPCHLPEDKYLCEQACVKTCPSGQHACVVPCYMPADKIKCKMPCERVCPSGHPCSQSCYEQCKECVIPVEKELSRCHHLARVPCHLPETRHKCESACDKTCPSSHPCMKPCNRACGDCKVLVVKTLPRCGHTVNMSCSESVSLHKCLEACRKFCHIGHPCMKVCADHYGMTCEGRCEVEMDKVLPKCKHVQRMFCCKESALADCSSPCEILLKCGHSCTNRCGKSCTVSCKVVVPDVLLPCLHEADLPCSIKPETYKCLKDVELTLCVQKHIKIVQCYKSSLIKEGNYEFDTQIRIMYNSAMIGVHHPQISGSLAIRCSRQCLRNLPFCAHRCYLRCYEPCLPCTIVCAKSCIHSQCKHRCSEPCTPCCKPCAWACLHHACRLTCREPCTRPVCDEPCKRKLPCKHACRGLCGEPCPDKCFKCNRMETKALEKALPGCTINQSIRFVQLRPCGDVLPVKYMDDWVKQSTRNSTCVMKTLQGYLSIICPLEHCKREVEYCPRYNAQLKRLSLSQSIAKRKIVHCNKYCKKFDEAKNNWLSHLRDEGFPIQKSFSSIEVCTLWLWNECKLLMKSILKNDSVNYLKICKHIEKENEFIKNVRISEMLETCKSVIGLSRLYMLLNVVRLSLVTRGPKLGVLDKCLKRLPSTNLDLDADKTWMNVLVVNEALKRNFTLKPAEEVVDLNELFESETSITSVNSEWISCTKGL